MYDAEVHFTDRHIGDLLEFIDQQPWAKNTAVMISADHGETFGEHKMYRHGFELWQELVWVPLLVRMPGAKPRRIDTPRGGVDLPVTILDLLDAPRPDGAQGVSLVPELLGEKSPEQRLVVSDLPRTSDNDRRRAIVWGDHKLIAHGDDEYFKLFDVGADPREQRDLAGKNKKLFDEMLQRYKEVKGRIRDVCPKIRKLKGRKKNSPC
jgi:arylsulfatase A-like enzyme